MWCTVHLLYRNGIRLPVEVAKASGVYGWLHMRRETPVVRMPKPEAFLFDSPEGAEHRPLLHLEACSLRAIVGGGIRLAGFDPHLSCHTGNHQSWWIIPGQRQP